MQENELEIKKIPASSHCLAPAKRIGCTKFCDLFCTRSNSLTFGTFYHFQYYTITVCNGVFFYIILEFLNFQTVFG